MKLWVGLFLCLGVMARPPSALALDPHDWEADTTESRSYERVRARHSESLAALDYSRVFRELERDLERTDVWSHDESIYQRLSSAVSKLNRSFEGSDLRSGDSAERAALLDTFLTRRATGAFQFPCPGGECFSRDDVVSYEELEALADAKAEDFLQRVRTLSMLLVDFKRPAVRKTVGSIQLARDRWATFIDHGRSQYPWEVVANGWILGGGTIERPPMKQLVLVHPTAAVEMTTEDIHELRAKQALAIEALGLIWYRWKNSNAPAEGLRWWGLSAIASVRDDMRPGVGMLLHYGRMVTLGASWHDDDSDRDWFDRSPFLIASFDLFQLAKERVPEYQRKLATLTVLASSRP